MSTGQASPLAWVDEHIEKVMSDVLAAEARCTDPTAHRIHSGIDSTIYDVARVMERLRERALDPNIRGQEEK